MVSPSSAGACVAPLPDTAGIFGTSRVDFALRRWASAAGRWIRPARHALLVLEQRLQQMRGRDPLMMLADRDGLGGLKETARPIGEFFKVHSTPLWLGADMVWPSNHTRPF